MIIAISKGRVFEASQAILGQIGIEIRDDLKTTRKLVLETNRSDIQIMLIRSFDVPTYVEYGAAELGIVGKDVLLEHPLGQECLEMVDLQIAKCRICLAGSEELYSHQSLNSSQSTYSPNQRFKIATKYPKITKQHFAKKNMQVDIVELSGAMELAPKIGLSNAIVDLVDTGETLKANHLKELETITTISSRLIVNPIHLKTNFDSINQIILQFKAVLD